MFAIVNLGADLNDLGNSVAPDHGTCDFFRYVIFSFFMPTSLLHLPLLPLSLPLSPPLLFS